VVNKAYLWKIRSIFEYHFCKAYLWNDNLCNKGLNLWKNKNHLAVCQNLVPLVNIKIAGKWMFIPLKMVLIGIDPYPFLKPPIIQNQW